MKNLKLSTELLIQWDLISVAKKLQAFTLYRAPIHFVTPEEVLFYLKGEIQGSRLLRILDYRIHKETLRYPISKLSNSFLTIKAKQPIDVTQFRRQQNTPLLLSTTTQILKMKIQARSLHPHLILLLPQHHKPTKIKMILNMKIPSFSTRPAHQPHPSIHPQQSHQPINSPCKNASALSSPPPDLPP
jgi:hypothetical protein